PVESKDLKFRISPDPGGWSTAWEEGGKQVALGHANPFRAGVTYELELEVKSADKKKTVHFTAYGPSSLDLIDEDEKKGLLDLDTAWTYRLQRLFEPGRLPEKYKSLTPVKCGTPVMTDFFKIQSRLKPETLDALKPYLVRPTHPESVFNRRIQAKKRLSAQKKGGFSGLLYAQRPVTRENFKDWCYTDHCHPNIRVWASDTVEGQRKAEEACNTIRTENIYEEFKKVMDIEPLPDAGGKQATDFEGEKAQANFKVYFGGNDRLDIYLVPGKELEYEDEEGHVSGSMGQCHHVRPEQKTPAYILIDQNLEGKYFKATLAHEIFHAFQFAYDSLEDDWWQEGTAVWSEHRIGKDWDTEQVYVYDAFDDEEHLLKTITLDEGLHEYGIYIFPFYLWHKYKDPMIGNIWKKCGEDETIALDAVESALGGNFRDIFKKFALLNYNDDSPGVPERYPEILGVYYSHLSQIKEIEKPGKQDPLEFEMPPLAVKYITISNKLPNPDLTPHFDFDLKGVTHFWDLSLQAMFDPDTSAREPEDWSHLKDKSLCTNFEDENFSGLVLVVANHSRDATYYPELKIEVDAERCVAGEASGKVRLRHVLSSYKEWSSGNAHGYSKGDRNMEATVYAQFEYHGSKYYEKKEELSDFYRLKSWDVVSSGGTMTEHRFHESPRPFSEGTYDSKARGEGYKDDEFHEATNELEVVIDTRTGKAKSVKFPVFYASIDWTGEWEQIEINSFGPSKSSGAIDSTEHSFRVDNLIGDKSVILQGKPMEGWKVKSGDGTKQMGGNASYVLKNEEGERAELHTKWNLMFSKHKKREKLD
ncbi:MAG: hypothetical protein JXB23_15550, partial [Candidatus Aminicenantes bacterium]|nr:hypothetical protein [Candidatus Aminicenantes bacterium]